MAGKAEEEGGGEDGGEGRRGDCSGAPEVGGACRGPEWDGRGGRGIGERAPALRDLLLAGLLVHDPPRPGPLHLRLPAALKPDAAPWGN